jgi:alcohol dehydrogenase class IV
VNHPSLPPSIIIYDPLLTLHTPLHLFLSTGVRALDHAVETLYRPKVPKGVKDMALFSLNGLMRGLKECKELVDGRKGKEGEEGRMGDKEVRVRTQLMVDAWES